MLSDRLSPLATLVAEPDFATELMKDVLDAYAQRDVERALDVWERDVELDALKTRTSANCSRI